MYLTAANGLIISLTYLSQHSVMPYLQEHHSVQHRSHQDPAYNYNKLLTKQNILHFLQINMSQMKSKTAAPTNQSYAKLQRLCCQSIFVLGCFSMESTETKKDRRPRNSWRRILVHEIKTVDLMWSKLDNAVQDCV